MAIAVWVTIAVAVLLLFRFSVIRDAIAAAAVLLSMLWAEALGECVLKALNWLGCLMWWF